MIALDKEACAILVATGLPDVQMVASGGFDKYSIDAALCEGACIDAFGVGTKIEAVTERPPFDMAYKLA